MDQTSDAARVAARAHALRPIRGDSPSEIEREIALTRERVSDALVELERKVDPRRTVSDHPLASVAVAFAIGVVLGTRRSGSRPAAVDSGGGGGHGLLHTVVDRVATAAATALSARLLHTSNHAPGR